MSKQPNQNELPKLALLSVTIIGIGIIGVIVFSSLSENLKMALGVSSLATIVGGITTLLNGNHKPTNNDVKGDQTINLEKKEEEK